MEILSDIGVVIYRSIISVLVLFIISRLTGPRQIAQLTFYDYIVGISIGSIAAMAVESNIKLYEMIISMVIFGGFAILFALWTDKSIVMRRFFSGKPSIMIYNGKIIEKSLKKNHFDINDLLLNCRLQGYFKIEDIAFAILESNGELSVMPKADKAPLTPYDMAMKPSESALEYNLIIDGEIMHENLKHYGKDEQWLNSKIKEQKVNSVKEIILGVGDSEDNLTIFLKSEVLPHNHFFM
ncbi:MAG: DUF421 domain-containing protein [Acutalibacteraceae bacterium]